MVPTFYLTLKKLAEKISDPKDSRVKLVSLTPLGRKISNEVDSFQKEIHMNILSQMNERERKDVISKLELKSKIHLNFKT